MEIVLVVFVIFIVLSGLSRRNKGGRPDAPPPYRPSRTITCPKCNGTGRDRFYPDHHCTRCFGSGRIEDPA
jgi:hypothetical protein